MTVRDVFVQGNRRYVRLNEKGGKELVMPCHHELEDYLTAYIEAAGLAGQPDTPLFRAMDNTTRKLGGNGLTRMKAWEMVQRRTADAGLDTHACNHTFRATGITTFLENGGELSKARDMAGHASIRTTQLYDRRSRAVKIDDVVLINLRAKPKE
jgi:site-specific recombinase XerD